MEYSFTVRAFPYFSSKSLEKNKKHKKQIRRKEITRIIKVKGKIVNMKKCQGGKGIGKKRMKVKVWKKMTEEKIKLELTTIITEHQNIEAIKSKQHRDGIVCIITDIAQ